MCGNNTDESKQGCLFLSSHSEVREVLKLIIKEHKKAKMLQTQFFALQKSLLNEELN